MFNLLTKNFCQAVQIKRPIIQAPMAGGIVTPHSIKDLMNKLEEETWQSIRDER